MCVCICLYAYIVNHESFRSNAQSAIVFACRNRPRVDRNDEIACVNLLSRAFASTVCNRPSALTCVRTRVPTCIGELLEWHYLR